MSSAGELAAEIHAIGADAEAIGQNSVGGILAVSGVLYDDLVRISAGLDDAIGALNTCAVTHNDIASQRRDATDGLTTLSGRLAQVAEGSNRSDLHDLRTDLSTITGHVDSDEAHATGATALSEIEAAVEGLNAALAHIRVAGAAYRELIETAGTNQQALVGFAADATEAAFRT